MSHADYRTLVDRGRKSGLRTTEIYSALASRPPAAGDPITGQADSNGFVPALDPQGHHVFKPQDDEKQR
jgi:hypothetical protein